MKSDLNIFFKIKSKQAKSIMNFSLNQAEKELLFLP